MAELRRTRPSAMRARRATPALRPALRVAVGADPERARLRRASRDIHGMVSNDRWSWPVWLERPTGLRSPVRVLVSLRKAILTRPPRGAASRDVVSAVLSFWHYYLASLTASPPQRLQAEKNDPKPHELQRKPISALVVPDIDGMKPP